MNIRAVISLLILVFGTAQGTTVYQWQAANDVPYPMVYQEDIETHCYDFRVDLNFFTKRIQQLGLQMLDHKDASAFREITAVNKSESICYAVKESWNSFDQHMSRSRRFNMHSVGNWKKSPVVELSSLFHITFGLCSLLLNTAEVGNEASTLLKLFSPQLAEEVDALETKLSHHAVENSVFTVRSCRNVTVNKYHDQIFYPDYQVDENPIPSIISQLKNDTYLHYLNLHVDVNNGTAYWLFQECFRIRFIRSEMLFRCEPRSEQRPFESLRLKTYTPGIKNGPQYRSAEFYAQLDANNTIVLEDSFWSPPEPIRRVLRNQRTDTHSESLLQLIKRGFLSVVEVADNSTHGTTPTPPAIIIASTTAETSTSHFELKAVDNVEFSVDWTLFCIVTLLIVSLLFNISLILARRSAPVPKTAESAQIIGSFSNEFFEEA